MKSLLRVLLLISGSGTTARAVIEAVQRGRLKGLTIVGVLASKSEAGGIEKAKALGIPTYVLERKAFATAQEFGEAILALCRKLNIDFISQNGWLPKTPVNVVKEYEGRIINQHPGPLDPGRGNDFGGKGMYGSRVICARLAYTWITGEDIWTEATVHYLTENYDEGELIDVTKLDMKQFYQATTLQALQQHPEILLATVPQVQEKLFPLEYATVIRTLQRFGTEKTVTGYKRTAPLIPEKNIALLEDVKTLAITLFPKG